jgi:hypothetical protein
MSSITIEVKGLAELEEKLGRIGAIRELRPAMEKTNKVIHADTQRYPPPSHKPMRWKSRKQRLFVIIGIREGRIEVPYRRKHSGGLAGSWVDKVSVIGSTLTGTVGSNSSYAPFVVGPKSQAEYHQGNWWTTATLLKRRKSDIEDIFASRIREVLRK